MSCGFYYVRKIANFPFVEVKHVTFWRSFYGICIILALFHKAKILSTKVGGIFALYSKFQSSFCC